MNYRLLGLLAAFLILKCQGMEWAPKEEIERPSDITEEQWLILTEYYGNKLDLATRAFRYVIKAYSKENISNKLKQKVRKALERHQKQRISLVYKGLASIAIATGAGYYTHNGCTSPETKLLGAGMSAGFGLLALKYGYEWYNLSVPTQEILVQKINSKMSSFSYNAGPSVLGAIRKIPELQGK